MRLSRSSVVRAERPVGVAIVVHVVAAVSFVIVAPAGAAEERQMTKGCHTDPTAYGHNGFLEIHFEPAGNSFWKVNSVTVDIFPGRDSRFGNNSEVYWEDASFIPTRKFSKDHLEPGRNWPFIEEPYIRNRDDSGVQFAFRFDERLAPDPVCRGRFTFPR